MPVARHAVPPLHICTDPSARFPRRLFGLVEDRLLLRCGSSGGLAHSRARRPVPLIVWLTACQSDGNFTRPHRPVRSVSSAVGQISRQSMQFVLSTGRLCSSSGRLTLLLVDLFGGRPNSSPCPCHALALRQSAALLSLLSLCRLLSVPPGWSAAFPTPRFARAIRPSSPSS